MPIMLVDDTLKIEVFYDESDKLFNDNICFCIVEDCPEEERIFRAAETNLYLTPDQAGALALALQEAVIVSAVSRRASD